MAGRVGTTGSVYSNRYVGFIDILGFSNHVRRSETAPEEAQKLVDIMNRIDKTVVGYGGLICYGEEAHVTNVAVDPVHHRTKIGSRILHDLILAAVDMGAEAVSLEVRVTNWGAQRLYGRFGFRPVGVRKNYYQEINEDALIMWLDGVRTAEYRSKLRALMQDVPEPVRPD